MSHADLLRSIPIFHGLSDDDLGALVSAVSERHFPAGRVIINQGDPGSEMFIVAAGHVNIFLPGEASRRLSLKDIAAGEYFGELALFDDKPRSASALATTDAVLLELTRATLSTYLTLRPQAAMSILQTMAARLRETNAMLSERASKNAVEEVEKHLTWGERLADKVAALNGSWTFIILLVGTTGGWMVIDSRLVRKRNRSLSLRLLQSAAHHPGGTARPAHRDEPKPTVAQGSSARRHGLRSKSKERGKPRDDPAGARRISSRSQ